jgi:hypothetical protein
MNTFLQCDWNDILKGKNAGQQFDIFMARTSAFSLSVVVFLSSPSSDLNFSSDIPVLVFLLELAYFQKILGM